MSVSLKYRKKEPLQGYESTIFVQFQNTEIKVEINLVVKGSVYQPILKKLCPIAFDMFNRKTEIICLNTLIKPSYLNIKSTYKKQFKGITSIEITCEVLEAAREKLFHITSSFFSDEKKEFLISFKKEEPKWELFPLSVIREFPCVKWKLHNIKMMDPRKRTAYFRKLEFKLGM